MKQTFIKESKQSDQIIYESIFTEAKEQEKKLKELK